MESVLFWLEFCFRVRFGSFEIGYYFLSCIILLFRIVDVVLENGYCILW